TDAQLVNAWGLAINDDRPGGPAFWVNAADSGVSVVYDQTGLPLNVVVTIPVPGDASAKSNPTGIVYNDSTSFDGDLFIFSTEQGAIAGWKSGPTATVRAQVAADVSYKGLAIIEVSGAPMLAATDFHGAQIDTFAGTYAH